MKYYVVSDIHGFYSIFRKALEKSGYFSEAQPHKLILLGDLFDRGAEAKDLQSFILDLLEKDEVVLIRGNHEDLFEQLVTKDGGLPYSHHLHNGTYDTALQLTGLDMAFAQYEPKRFASAGRSTPYFTKIIPAARNWFETERFVFVHGWIPCIFKAGRYYEFDPDWRNATAQNWYQARWYNGMDASQTCLEKKTVVCGHWHSSYGHWRYQNKGTEFGADADFTPYVADGIIALDACTAYSGIINVYIIEDEEIK